MSTDRKKRSLLAMGAFQEPDPETGDLLSHFAVVPLKHTEVRCTRKW